MAKTALFDWHVAHGAKMVDFAGYEMPVQYEQGIVKEHLHTRVSAGLFDVSHMGQVLIHADVAAIEAVLPTALVDAEVGQQRYSFLLNAQGGIIDDLMITRREQDFYAVLNASRKEIDVKVLRAALGDEAVVWWENRALLALQGPEAVAVLSAWVPEVAELGFMRGAAFSFDGVSCWVSRSGYTGEDGFEISVPNDFASTFAERLLSDERVQPCGLGARDSLRLEAGLCLYGNDITEETTPIEAGLGWAISKVRRPDGARAGGYPAAEILAQQWADGAPRKRVALKIEGRLPVRAHAPIFADGEVVGEVTSGGFAPSVEAPIAMGLVQREAADKALYTEVRGKRVDFITVSFPFITKRYQS